MNGKRSESGKEQCDKVLARGGELTKGEWIYEEGEKWTERVERKKDITAKRQRGKKEKKE